MFGLLKRLILGSSHERSHARAAALVHEGYVLARSGKLTPALAKYDEACREAPDFGLAALNRALCLQDLYNLKGRTWSSSERTATLVRIADDLDRAVTLLPNEWAAWRCLGHVSRRLCRYTRADEAFATLLERAPDDYPHRDEALRERRVIAPMLGKERALERVHALLVDKSASKEELDLALDAVRALVDEARSVHARTKASRTGAPVAARASAESSAPGDVAPIDDDALLPVDTLFAVGVLERRAGEIVRAAELFALVVDLDKEHVGAHQELSTLAALAGNAEAALRHASAAYRADPSNAGLVCNVGVAHLALGQLDRAREFIALARDMAPRDPIVERAHLALQERERETRSA